MSWLELSLILHLLLCHCRQNNPVKHYVAIYQEQNKCVCEDVNPVMTEWWILEVLVGWRAVCCTSFSQDSFQSVQTLHQSTPRKSPEAINLHSLPQSFILAPGLTNMFQHTTKQQLVWKQATERNKERQSERQKFKIQYECSKMMLTLDHTATNMKHVSSN
jgi:hypothetical protein